MSHEAKVNPLKHSSMLTHWVVAMISKCIFKTDTVPVGEDRGVWTPYPRGSTPLPPPIFFLPTPPLFPQFFFRVPPPKFQIFCPRPPPIWPSAHFFCQNPPYPRLIDLPSTHKRHTLTHWGRATHICVGKLTTIGSDDGLSPGRRQAIIRTNAGILLIQNLGLQWDMHQN